MTPRELEILEEIECGIYESDAEFAERIASGPCLSPVHKAGLAAAALAGMATMMLFSAHLVFGVFGYLVMVVAGTIALRNRPVKPAQESPGAFFHRLTGGLFRNTGAVMEPGYDEF